MKIIKAGYEILTPINRTDILKSIEIAGRTCYKSEDKITEDSASKFVKMLINRGHEAMIEHSSMSVKFICDRGVSHEIVRHRLFSFAQESTRYCNYGKKGIVMILPEWFQKDSKSILLSFDSITEDSLKVHGEFKLLQPAERCWLDSGIFAENTYNAMLAYGWQPQQARSSLPNSTKTEIVVTGNPREFRHFFKLRTPNTAHSQMREVAIPLLYELQEKLPELFGDIEVDE